MKPFRDELAFWESWVKPALHRPAEHRVAWKVGTSTRPGLPDVWWSWAGAPGGWLELKYLRGWPKRADTVVRIDATAEQRAHLIEAGLGGASAWILLGVEREWFLVPPAIVECSRTGLHEDRAWGACDDRGAWELARALISNPTEIF